MQTFTFNAITYRTFTRGGYIHVERQDGDRWTRTYSLAVVLEARKLLGVS